ncbi:hypothetical protein JOD97_001138 [Duganella sp. 1411]|uniref:hypothetical protein n=1 Tax=Duganella sp. 1411 TaxID=2806572 RepID=UPI001AE9ECC9|nr:hypothetical protein [Duganella sp. 1411]MBP1203124.1 hypothetical protein [Duganella sp. 1411]
MHPLSLPRLYLLRAVYLMIALGLAMLVGPGIIHHDKPWEFMQGVVNCMLAAFGLLCAVGVRYPLQMLPVLLWELIWKTLWLSIVALPAWRAGQMDQTMVENVFACLLVVVIPIVMPWGYLIENYWKRPGDRWRGAADSPATRA